MHLSVLTLDTETDADGMEHAVRRARKDRKEEIRNSSIVCNSKNNFPIFRSFFFAIFCSRRKLSSFNDDVCEIESNFFSGFVGPGFR